MPSLARSAELWRSLELRAQVALVGSAVAVLLTAYFLFQLAAKPSYTVVASGMTASEGGDVANSLEGAGISYELRDGGTTVAVDKAQVTEARVALAQDGLPNGGHDGFELFDSKSLGSTDFEQKVKYQRALEGEIARTVEGVDGVSSAQIQLVLPKQSLFLDDGTKASAAVLLESGGMLDAAAVSGIARLVSSSVEGLKTEDVTITDETGSLLWPSGGGASGDSGSRLKAEQQYGNAVSTQIDAMLLSTLGPNKAFARVHADLDLDQQTIESVTYGKKGTKLNDQTDVETLQGKGGAAATTANSGTTGNVAGLAGSTAGGAGSESNYSHRKGTTTFGVDKTVESKTIVPGAVQRLSIALVVDKSVPAPEVKSLQESVSALAGIDPKRGDTISVARVSFDKTAAAAPAAPGMLAAAGGPLGVGKWFLLLLGGAVFLFAIRRGLKRRESEPLGEPTWLREVTGSRSLSELEAGQAGTLGGGPDGRRPDVNEQVEEIVRRQPDTVAAQVTSWMRE